MLYLHSFVFNPFQENTYIISNDNNDCWIVDPGMYDNAETKQLIDFITEKKLTPKSIINTHTHLDHIFGVQALKGLYNIPFGIHKLDEPVLAGAKGSAMLFGFNFSNTPEADFYIDEANEIQLGTDKLAVFLTPGHSPGSICFYNKQEHWLIGGDVLFAGSIGRTDLPGGNYDVLLNSIKTSLWPLPDETVVHSGHGPLTKIGNEKASNPFLQDL